LIREGAARYDRHRDKPTFRFGVTQKASEETGRRTIAMGGRIRNFGLTGTLGVVGSCKRGVLAAEFSGVDFEIEKR